jgi:hypothetical protein
MTSVPEALDSEDLRVRLGVIEDATVRTHIVNVVHGVFLGRGRILRVDLGAMEKAIATTSPREVWAMASESFTNVWSVLEDVQLELKPVADLYGAAADLGAENLDGLDFALETPAPASPAPAATAKAKPDQPVVARMVENAWAMSYVLKNEIQGFQRRMLPLLSSNDGWELVGACQDHLARLRAALDALLTGITAGLPGAADGPQAVDQSAETLAARELRVRVFALRDEIVAIDAQLKTRTASEWQDLLATAKRQMDAFMFGPGFAWLRADDKRSFLRGQKVLGVVLELWSPLRALPAQRAIGALARYLEALEVINQRECLVLHDRAALTTVAAKLQQALAETGTGARDAIAAALKALAEAQGRDRELDDLLNKTMEPGRAVATEAILNRVQAVLKTL